MDLALPYEPATKPRRTAARRGLTRRVRSMQRMIHFRRAIRLTFSRHCWPIRAMLNRAPHTVARVAGFDAVPRALIPAGGQCIRSAIAFACAAYVIRRAPPLSLPQLND